MNHSEVIGFYLDLVRRAQERGIRCAITSHYTPVGNPSIIVFRDLAQGR